MRFTECEHKSADRAHVRKIEICSFFDNCEVMCRAVAKCSRCIAQLREESGRRVCAVAVLENAFLESGMSIKGERPWKLRGR
jgi:hypothetical protein